MKGLILYRSYYGNTKKVAEAIAGQIRTSGHEPIVQDLRIKLPDLNGIDFIIIGAPTRIAGVTSKAKGVLKRLKKRFAGKPVAVFDLMGPIPENSEEEEKINKWLYPGAAGIMHKIAEKYGLNVYEKTLRCRVKGMQGPLAENELEKAISFTQEFMSYIIKKY